MLGRVTFIITVDQTAREHDLDRTRCRRQRDLVLIEGQDDFEKALELALRHGAVAIESRAGSVHSSG